MRDLDEMIRETLHRSVDTFEPEGAFSVPAAHHRARVLRFRTLVTVLIAALFVASGALIATRSPSTKNGSFIESSKPPTQDPHYSIALAIAKGLAEGAAVPPGSVSTGPYVNGHFVPEMPAGNNHFVDVARYWNVPMSLRETVKWLERHPPAGRRYSVGSGGANYNSLGWHLLDDENQAYSDRTIQYEIVTARGGHSLMRVDGTTLWVSSTPTADSLGAPKLRVTIAGGCPLSLGSYKDISNPPSQDLKSQLVPSTEPTGELRCDYEGPAQGAAPHLKKQTALGENDARKIAKEMRTLKVGFSGPFVGSCLIIPAPIRVIEIVVLSYPGRPDVDLWFASSCRGYVANGFVMT